MHGQLFPPHPQFGRIFFIQVGIYAMMLVPPYLKHNWRWPETCVRPPAAQSWWKSPAWNAAMGQNPGKCETSSFLTFNKTSTSFVRSANEGENIPTCPVPLPLVTGLNEWRVPTKKWWSRRQQVLYRPPKLLFLADSSESRPYKRATWGGNTGMQGTIRNLWGDSLLHGVPHTPPYLRGGMYVDERREGGGSYKKIQTFGLNSNPGSHYRSSFSEPQWTNQPCFFGLLCKLDTI